MLKAKLNHPNNSILYLKQDIVSMCMSRLISFVLADSSCEPRAESENNKMKN